MQGNPSDPPSVERRRELTIGRLADLVGVPVSTIRYYEKRKLIAPKGRAKGDYRVYDPESVRTLRLILSAKNVGFTLRETMSLLSLRDPRDCQEILPIVESKLEGLRRSIQELKMKESRLIALSILCEDLDDESCKFINALGDQLPPILE